MSEFDPLELDDGVREMVIRLRSHDFNTTDSGDGSKHGSMAGALPYPHVVMEVEPDDLLSECDRLTCLVNDPGWQVEGTYIPDARSKGIAIILVSLITESDVAAMMDGI